MLIATYLIVIGAIRSTVVTLSRKEEIRVVHIHKQ